MWYIECGGVKNNRFNRNIFREINDFEELDKIQESFKGNDYYNTIYVYDNIDNIDESNIYGPLMIDLDMELETEKDFQNIKTDLLIAINSLKVIFGIRRDEISIYFSGNKGFHLSISPTVLGLKPMKNLHIVYRLISEEVSKHLLFDSLDTKIYDKRRLIRVNGTINSKTGLYKIPMSLKEIKNMSLEELKKRASSPIPDTNETSIALNNTAKKRIEEFVNNKVQEQKKNNKPKGQKIFINNRKKLPNTPCIIKLLKEGVEKGQRNNASAVFSSVLFQNGFNLEETKDIILRWNQEKVKPPMSEKEALSTVYSAHKMLLHDRGFGCNSLGEVSVCSEQCPLYNINKQEEIR